MRWGVDLSWGISFCLLWRGTVFHKSRVGSADLHTTGFSFSRCRCTPLTCHFLKGAMLPPPLTFAYGIHTTGMKALPSFSPALYLVSIRFRQEVTAPTSRDSHRCSSWSHTGVPSPVTALSLPQHNGYVAAIP